MFLLQQKIYVIKKKATYKKVFLLMSCLWVLEKWCHPIITLEFLDPQNIWKKKDWKKNLEIFLYLTLRIVSQFFREFLQNEAEIQPRNSNIWASNYTSHLVFPRALASDNQNPTFLGLLYLSYLKSKKYSKYKSTKNLKSKNQKIRKFLKIRRF